MNDWKIILVVLAAAIAAVIVISLFKRSTRKRGYGDSYRRKEEHKETDDLPDGS